MKKFKDNWPIIVIAFFVIFVGCRIITKPTYKIKGTLIAEINGNNFVNDKWVTVPIEIYVNSKKDRVVLACVVGAVGDYSLIEEVIISQKDLDCRIETLKNALCKADKIKETVQGYIVKIESPANCSIMDGFKDVRIFTREPQRRNFIEVEMECKSGGVDRCYVAFPLERIKGFIFALEKSKENALNLKNESIWDQTDIDEKMEEDFKSSYKKTEKQKKH